MITTKIEEEWFRTVFSVCANILLVASKKIKISKSEKILLILFYEKKEEKVLCSFSSTTMMNFFFSLSLSLYVRYRNEKEIQIFEFVNTSKKEWKKERKERKKNRVGRRVLETKQKYNFFFFHFPYSDRNEWSMKKKRRPKNNFEILWASFVS